MHELRTYFDLREANGLIPQLERLFAELGRIQMQVNTLCRAAEASGVRIDIEDAMEGRFDHICSALPSIGARLKDLSLEYMDILDEIADIGVVLCDVDMGLVGFHSWFSGQEILLSWQYGEPVVGHWHGVTENHGERRSIELLIMEKPGGVSLH
ncbi:MAG: DUF2203 domain-containing protein [bacterium]